MKISLVQPTDSQATSQAAQYQVLEHDLQSCKQGDWTAKHQIQKTFQPLIRSLAHKRAGDDTKAVNLLLERGKEGLMQAVARYKTSIGARNFRVFALNHIEDAMDGKPSGGWLRRLFYRSG